MSQAAGTVRDREIRKSGNYIANTLWRSAMELANSELSCDNSQDDILQTLKLERPVMIDLLGHNILGTRLGEMELIMPIYRYDTLLKMLMFQPNERFVLKRSQIAGADPKLVEV